MVARPYLLLLAQLPTPSLLIRGRGGGARATGRCWSEIAARLRAGWVCGDRQFAGDGFVEVTEVSPSNGTYALKNLGGPYKLDTPDHPEGYSGRDCPLSRPASLPAGSPFLSHHLLTTHQANKEDLRLTTGRTGLLGQPHLDHSEPLPCRQVQSVTTWSLRCYRHLTCGLLRYPRR